ncbi:hydroxyphenylacetyl-CoA thioesterase PaaI [Kineococcus sp. G2]|uniref:hydroxyphenylacetyl-CoA thioesterase PaaI n=1 Tax=Kineococcus sp. G2 TaxID=3127484 RepID=UPI00301E16A0
MTAQVPPGPTPPTAAGVAGMQAADAVLADLGLELLSVGEGTAKVGLTVRASMTNGYGNTHGGYLFLLADTAFAYACNSRGTATVAAGADIAFLEPTRAGDTLVATAEERVLRGRSGLYDVRVECGDRVVAEFRGRSRAVPLRPADPLR